MTKTSRFSVLMCAPTHYAIQYEINPWILRPALSLSKEAAEDPSLYPLTAVFSDGNLSTMTRASYIWITVGLLIGESHVAQAMGISASDAIEVLSINNAIIQITDDKGRRCGYFNTPYSEEAPNEEISDCFPTVKAPPGALDDEGIGAVFIRLINPAGPLKIEIKGINPGPYQFRVEALRKNTSKADTLELTGKLMTSECVVYKLAFDFVVPSKILKVTRLPQDHCSPN